MMEIIIPRNTGGVSVRRLPGANLAIQVLHCNCEVETGLPMRLFRVGKGQVTSCPNGHGEQKTKQVISKGHW